MWDITLRPVMIFQHIKFCCHASIQSKVLCKRLSLRNHHLASKAIQSMEVLEKWNKLRQCKSNQVAMKNSMPLSVNLHFCQHFVSLSLVLGSKGVWNWDAIICSQDSASGSNHPLPTGHLHSPGRHCPTMEWAFLSFNTAEKNSQVDVTARQP